MAITMEEKCDRCSRLVKHEVKDVADAASLELARTKREANAAALEAFIAKMDPNEVPDMVVLLGKRGAGHNLVTMATLCDFKEEGKRSCAARIAELAEAMDKLEERKKSGPRKKKDVAAPIPLTEEAKK